MSSSSLRSLRGPVAAISSALFAGALLFACAGSETEIEDDGTDASAEAAPAPKPSATGTTPAKDAAAPPKVCASSCTQDSDCQNSCPAASGAACCDTQTKTCFRSTGSTCPVPQTQLDGSTPTGPY